jgi:hypothetical protein
MCCCAVLQRGAREAGVYHVAQTEVVRQLRHLSVHGPASRHPTQPLLLSTLPCVTHVVVVGRVAGALRPLALEAALLSEVWRSVACLTREDVEVESARAPYW